MMNKNALVPLFICLAVVAIGLYSLVSWRTMPTGNNRTVMATPSPQIPTNVTLTGTYVCLPHKNTKGPVTLECALGLQTDDGLYYALDTSALSPETAYSFQTNQRLEVKGLLVPVEQLSGNTLQKYKIVGVVKVEQMSVVEVP